MERSNQPPEPECCRREGQANAAHEDCGAEQLAGGVHREIHEPQAGDAHRLSNPASKLVAAGEDAFQLAQLHTGGAVKGEAPTVLPGSKSVAHEARTVWNHGDPQFPRRTNSESQAGRKAQRQEGQTQGTAGVGSLHSSAGQCRESGADQREGGDRTIQSAQVTSTVRMTEQSWPTFLRAIADKARRTPNHRFGDLYRHLNHQALRASFYLLRKDAASGVDGVTFQAYEENLEANLIQLVQRLKAKSYHARLVRRKYIPKGNGKLRPLGIPALEDKLLQSAVT